MVKICSIIVFFLYAASCVSAQNDTTGIKIPSDDKERLLIRNLKLSVSDFLKAYMSSDLNQRRFAEMYLIGVLNASKGKEWCGYKGLLPTSIQEEIYIGFKYNKVSQQQEASNAIISIMSKTLPCKGK